MGAQPFRFATLEPLSVYPTQTYVPSGNGVCLMPEVHQVAASPTALSHGEPSATHFTVPQPFQEYCGAYSFQHLAESNLIPQASLHGGEGSSFPGSALHNDTVESGSVLGILMW